jgi:hypothetical protein
VVWFALRSGLVLGGHSFVHQHRDGGLTQQRCTAEHRGEPVLPTAIPPVAHCHTHMAQGDSDLEAMVTLLSLLHG